MSLLHAAREISNASSPLPWLVVSGQPSAAALAELHTAGIGVVIDIRDSMEPREIDEPSVVTSLGMRYVNAPMSFGALSNAAMEQVLVALRAARGTPTLLHCNSANRTGGPLIAYLMLDEGMTEESAVDTAMRAGLRSAEVLEFATTYARENRK